MWRLYFGARVSKAPGADNSKRVPGRPFPKGVCPNPGGQPKGKRISTWMAELGEMAPSEWPKIEKTLPANGLIALARIKAAMGKGGEKSTEIIQDRTEGKVVQPVSGEITETKRIVLIFPEAAA